MLSARARRNEFDRQLETLLRLGYPALAGMTPAAFTTWCDPLRPVVESLSAGEAQPVAERETADDVPAAGRVPLVLVPSSPLVAAAPLVELLRLPGSDRPGILDPHHGEDGLAAYLPLPDLCVPDAPLYLLTGIDRGDEFRGIPPQDALVAIRARGRSPLTVHEGIALVTQFPEFLVKNHCFMLSGSRRGDRRVPALWISQRAPKLGWCWDGNPHSWLGSASATARIAGA